MLNSREQELLDILTGHFNPREEGWMWVAAYVEDQPGGVVNQVEGDYDEPVAFADSLAKILTGCGADRSFIALCRREGRPLERDRELWRRLRAQVPFPVLVDLLSSTATARGRCARKTRRSGSRRGEPPTATPARCRGVAGRVEHGSQRGRPFRQFR